MRSLAAISLAIERLRGCLQIAIMNGDEQAATDAAVMIDILKWASGDDDAKFAKVVMERCDTIDRATRQ